MALADGVESLTIYTTVLHSISIGRTDGRTEMPYKYRAISMLTYDKKNFAEQYGAL